MQYFNGDADEIKVVNATNLLFANQQQALDGMFQGVYNSKPMAEFLYDNQLVALSQVINREVFIETINEIFEAWSFAGSFESYLTVLKKIFGESSVIEFSYPTYTEYPEIIISGAIHIDITSSAQEVAYFVARQKTEAGYEYFNVVDEEGNKIIFYTLLTTDGQLDVTKIIRTIVPAGIGVTISYNILDEEEFRSWLKAKR